MNKGFAIMKKWITNTKTKLIESLTPLINSLKTITIKYLLEIDYI